jgi:uncharacterized protein
VPQASTILRPFTLLVKPTSADCNLRCTYCFYLEKCSLYPDMKVHRMSDDVLEAMIGSYMATEQPNYSIGWQGGEPTLMGVDFFRKAVALEKKYGRPGSVVSNGLQTNATLIDDEFAAFLGEYKFLVGVSIDGPEHIHNTFRRDLGDRGSHERVLKGIEALEKHRVEYNALVLVSRANVGHAREVYEYLKGLGILFHQYIPCVEFDEAGELLPFAITGEEWGAFLVELFDVWVKEDVRRVSIRDFDAIVGHMVTGRYSMCVQTGNCNGYFVVEHNGDVYPCDFFVDRAKRLGSVLFDSWATMRSSKKYIRFGAQKSEWNEACSKCPYLRYCSGDCIKQRHHSGHRDPSSLSWLCPGWRRFYAHTLATFEEISVELMKERSDPSTRRATPTGRIVDPAPGWNDPCYCGSEKKYRLCHGAPASRAGRSG